MQGSQEIGKVVHAFERSHRRFGFVHDDDSSINVIPRSVDGLRIIVMGVCVDLGR